MKQVFLFLVLSIVFSGLFACNSASTSSTKVSETNQTADGNTNTAEGNTNTIADKKDSEYPLIPVAMAQTEIKKTDDATFKLEDKKGKVILINLWATWCGPCRGEMPHLVEMQETYGEKGFEVIGLDIDPEPVEEINEFAKTMKLNYQLGWAERDLVGEFYRISKFNAIPQSFLIDRDNRLRGVFMGGGKKVITEMKATVEKVVNEGQ
jgi:thiol-disulfide isomerase/thioredoxin